MKRLFFPQTVLSLAGITALFLGAGCSAPAGTEEVSEVQSYAFGDTLPGLQADADLLVEAREAFAANEGIGDGVGPIFNESACGNCHTDGAMGGAGVQIERRFGRFANGTFNGQANRGGSLRQLFTVANFNNPDLPAGSRGRCQPGNPTLCCVPLEVEPSDATVRNVGRLTTPLFGLGLVDSLPDSTFDAIAAAQPAAIRGTVNRAPIDIPNPGDPSQAAGTTRVTRFGWKANVPSLMQFSADAYVNEMAITTQSCFRGQSLNAFAIESAPNGTPVADGCDDLAARQDPAQNPGGLTATQWAQVDDAVGSCAGGRTEIQDDVFLFAVFMTSLAPGARDFSNAIEVSRGDPLFTSTGCAGCHVRNTFRTPANPAPLDIDGGGEETIRVPGNFAFNPYSDFLTHDMGALGDQIGNDGDNLVATRRMRTAPLWGIRVRNKLLHDGRCSDIRCAILAHAGQGQASRDAFTRLTSAQQHSLTEFVRSL